METQENAITTPRTPHGLGAMIAAAIGSIFASKGESPMRPRGVRFVSWAGRAQTDAWFAFELEQKRNQALLYYARNQVR